LSHCFAVITTSKLRTGHSNNYQSIYMSDSNIVHWFFLKLCCFSCTPLKGTQKLVAQWSKWVENNGECVKTWCYCTNWENIVLCAELFNLQKLIVQFCHGGPNLGSSIKYTSPNLLTYLYYPSLSHTKFLLVVWRKFFIHTCFIHALWYILLNLMTAIICSEYYKFFIM